MSTLISEFRTPVRAVLGDFNSVVRRYADSAIDAVITMLIKTGQPGSGYTLITSDTVISPAVTGTAYGRLVYLAAKTFVAPNAGGYSYRTRALGESFGEQRIFIQQLEQFLHDIDSNGGAMFGTHLGFRSWFLSISGLDPWAELSDMTINAPVSTVSVGRDGLTVT